MWWRSKLEASSDISKLKAILKLLSASERQKILFIPEKILNYTKTLIRNYCEILHTFKQVLSSVSLFLLCFGVEASPDLNSMRNKEGCVSNINNGIEIFKQEKRYSMQDVIQLKHRAITSTLRRDAGNNLNMKRNV